MLINRLRPLFTPEDDSNRSGGDDGASGDGGEPKNADDGIDVDALKRENAELKSKLGSVAKRVEKLDTLEAERAERQRKAEEKERLEKEGAKKLLEEKDEKLQSAMARVEAFEKRQLEAAAKLFDGLPKEAQEAIEPLREKLDVADWVELVERQHEIKTKSAVPDVAEGGFMRPGDKGTKASGHRANPKTLEILDTIGRGDEGIKLIHTVKDPETGAHKFTRHVRKFFGDMNPVPMHKLKADR